MGLLLLTIVLVALPGMRSPIVLDDELQIAHVAQFSGVWDCFAQPDGFGFFRPFKNLIYYGLQEVAGGSMLIWHGVGMGIHLAAVGAANSVPHRVMARDQEAPQGQGCVFGP